MPNAPKILVFAGSIRDGSWNQKLATPAAKALKASGADVTPITLADYDLPIMNEDLEAAKGVPENAQKLKALMKEHAGFLISCPEYNSSITPLLKNVIDWCSRKEEGEQPLECYTGKVIGLVSASPGALGGLRCLYHVRDIFLNIRAVVLPDMVAVNTAPEAFNDKGELTGGNYEARVNALAARMVEVTSKLNA